MTTAKVVFKYGFNEKDCYTMTQWFNAGDTSSKVGPGGTLDMTTLLLVPADHQPISNLSTFMENYLVCLQESCEADIQPLSILIEQYAETGDGISDVINSATYDVANWAPPVANIPRRGPRGRPFIGGKQAVEATNRTGWLRWHYLSGKFAALPDKFAPSQISETFATYYSNLRVFGSNGLGYAVLSYAVQVGPVVTSKSLPGLLLYYGTTNG